MISAKYTADRNVQTEEMICKADIRNSLCYLLMNALINQHPKPRRNQYHQNRRGLFLPYFHGQSVQKQQADKQADGANIRSDFFRKRGKAEQCAAGHCQLR